MHKIVCPNCGEPFEIDDSAYSKIVLQIRDEAFQQDVLQYRKDAEALQKQEQERLEAQYAERMEKAVELAQLRAEEQYQRKLSQRDLEIQRLESQVAAQSSATDLKV